MLFSFLLGPPLTARVILLLLGEEILRKPLATVPIGHLADGPGKSYKSNIHLKWIAKEILRLWE